MLYTISFQAPAFHEKFGWRRFGDVRCDSRGTNRMFMTKTLRWAPAARAGVRARRGAR
ncbi:GNAT family acetyltransferase [Burkholderia pseudomallei]|nr:GNAT family acetyltransferase [Burkholderia pseudomallei]